MTTASLEIMTCCWLIFLGRRRFVYIVNLILSSLSTWNRKQNIGKDIWGHTGIAVTNQNKHLEIHPDTVLGQSRRLETYHDSEFDQSRGLDIYPDSEYETTLGHRSGFSIRQEARSGDIPRFSAWARLTSGDWPGSRVWTMLTFRDRLVFSVWRSRCMETNLDSMYGQGRRFWNTSCFNIWAKKTLGDNTEFSVRVRADVWRQTDS